MNWPNTLWSSFCNSKHPWPPVEGKCGFIQRISRENYRCKNMWCEPKKLVKLKQKSLKLFATPSLCGRLKMCGFIQKISQEIIVARQNTCQIEALIKFLSRFDGLTLSKALHTNSKDFTRKLNVKTYLRAKIINENIVKFEHELAYEALFAIPSLHGRLWKENAVSFKGFHVKIIDVKTYLHAKKININIVKKHELV